MKKIYSLLLTMIALGLCVSCNDEWKDEQFKHLISFKAPINHQGVTPVYVRYKPDGKITYQLPLLVSGSTDNDKNLTVHIAEDADTLNVLNQERFSTRTELFYKQLGTQHYTRPETVNIPAGSNTALAPIDLSLANLDMSDKWVLPLTIVDNPAYGYETNTHKDYSKALLRIFPFNDYSGEYGATTYKVYFAGSENEAIVPEYKTAYVVDENTVFFYAGLVDEDYQDRKHYKIFVRFNDDNEKSLTITTDNPDIRLEVKGNPYYIIDEKMDEVLPYLNIVSVFLEFEYEYRDYTAVPEHELHYIVKGSLTMERRINIQIPDEDQAIQW
jgi:Domain of unknown function (DUF1735).